MLGRSIARHLRVARRAGWRLALGVTAIGGLVMVAAPGSETTAGASKSPLYIGSVLGVTGSFAGFDAPQYYGLQTVINLVNKQGGLLGHKLIYVNITDNSAATKFVPAMQTLLGEHKYTAVFPTPVAYVAQLQYTNAEHIITFGGGTPTTTDFNTTKWPVSFNDAPLATIQIKYQAEALQQWAGTTPVKVGVLVNTITGSLVQITHLTKLLQSQGVTVLPEQQVAPTATDVTVQLAQLKNEGANIIYPFPNNSLCTATFTGVQTLAWKVRILGSANCLSQSVVSTIPATVMPEVRYFAVGSTMLDSAGKPPPKMASFVKQLHVADATAAPGIAGVSADAIHDLVWAANYTHSVTESKLLKALNSMHKVTIPDSTFYQEPNPRWSPTDHLMDNATFDGYYGIANVSSPQVTGFWHLTTPLALKKK